ncbi:hypothetical protein IP90_00949 [Luteimonas cucumeris]|uniref:Uncharacterized protein n=1 Tax=Luteimonas cucumeris TaxID=985012 RepID=A0A562LB02_9GAMM|nr:hypothetical protein [Luteimonas cucumeris]TWI04811.1 hypothetical protein IP90_00949 [Luteimonas cucumeris]
MNTHRAYMGADNTVTCWVRDEEGKRDLSATDLTVVLGTYPATAAVTTLEAAQVVDGSDIGPVTFDVEQAMSDRYLSPGLFQFQVKADNEVVYSGLLEMV